MRWVLFGIGSLATLVAIVAAIGSTLPRNHTASRTLRVKRPPADVRTAVTAATGASSVPVDVIESHPPLRLVTRVRETEKMFGGSPTRSSASCRASSSAITRRWTRS